MLPIPNLDDKNFIELFEDAKKLIHQFAPDWTDYNLHDPGITLIELFSWLTEVQRYYLNRVTDKNYVKFLKLLGVYPLDAASSYADVTFTYLGYPENDVTVPAGTRLAAGDIPFETLSHLTVSNTVIGKIAVLSGWDYIDKTEVNSSLGVYYYPFGENSAEGSEFYIGFDSKKTPFELSKTYSLYFKMFEATRSENGLCLNEKSKVIPSVKLVWEYCKKKGSSVKWYPLSVVKDETNSFYNSGRLIFKAPRSISNVSFTWTNDGKERHWIRCRIEEGIYELPPKLDTVLVNTVPAVQRRTFCETISLSGTGKPKQVYEAKTAHSIRFDNFVAVKEANGGWKDWERVAGFGNSLPHSAHYTLIKNDSAVTSI